MALPPKVCPECRTEYLHTASVCSDCDVALVDPGGLSAPAELPPASELLCLRAAAAGWVVRLSDLLREAGIAHRVEPVETDDASRHPFGVFVRPEDEEPARAIDAEYLRREFPDLPEPADSDAGADDRCPACGDSLPSDASECPGCGIVLASPE